MRSHHISGETFMPRQPGCFAIEGAAWFAVEVGVASKVKPIAEMVLADTESRQNRRADFVCQGLKIIADTIKPVPRGNLLTKDCSRLAYLDERKPYRP